MKAVIKNKSIYLLFLENHTIQHKHGTANI